MIMGRGFSVYQLIVFCCLQPWDQTREGEEHSHPKAHSQTGSALFKDTNIELRTLMSGRALSRVASKSRSRAAVVGQDGEEQ